MRLMVALVVFMLTLPLSAQEKEDSIFTFRFLTGRDMFYAPGLNNGSELKRLFECVDRNRDLITSRKIYLYVDGYYKENQPKGLVIGRTRSNRLKSELITRKGLKESNFITRNHPAQRNLVTLRFVPHDQINIIPRDAADEVQPATDETIVGCPQELQSELIAVTEILPPDAECDSVQTPPVVDPVTPVTTELDEATPEEETAPADLTLATDNATKKVRDWNVILKTNMLGYAVLMPNLEIEWKFAKRWSVALEGQGAWWAKESAPRKVYRLATLIPEVRYWAIDRSKWHGMYVGVFGGIGTFDLYKGSRGHEGEGYMAGASVGYMWPIAKHLSLDASIGAGYLRARDKEYIPLDGHFLYQLTKNRNYVGPLRLKLSLAWRF